MVWYAHLFQNFPQFIVIHTVQGFGIVNKAEVDVFLELSCFFNDPVDVGNLISDSNHTLPVCCGISTSLFRFWMGIHVSVAEVNAKNLCAHKRLMKY